MYTEVAGGLKVDSELFAFVRDEALPGTGVEEADFWSGTAELVAAFSPRIQAALQRRDELQAAIDSWHRSHGAVKAGDPEYREFLRSIGYVEDDPGPFTITTEGVDPEIATLPGPQLVVPLLNARFAANAANARWGSLYDALYGSDVISDSGKLARGADYNEIRGAAVISWARDFLDASFPLQKGSHHDATAYRVAAGALVIDTEAGPTGLAVPTQFVGYRGSPDSPEVVLLVHHGLHVELHIDRTHPVGRADRAGIRDVVLEAATTCIMDLEDSVAAVDASDKVLGYRNWLLLMQGRLSATFEKDGKIVDRSLAPDREYTAADGSPLTLPGRALLMIRHTGHLLTTDAVLDSLGKPIPEGVLDALVTGLGSLHDLRGGSSLRNSRTGSIYVVKPKLHGPDEVALTCQILERAEHVLGLPARTIKIGIMDEERRMSVNLAACIHAARDRVSFINTGFLDRTGDEIRTSLYAGPVIRKGKMKTSTWLRTYEDSNVDIGLRVGFSGRAQIGKGMWAAPDNMAQMLEEKIAHPQAGANCAWVPSPTAATLHAVHYHRVDVMARQRELAKREPAGIEGLLEIPVADKADWSEAERRHELDTNVQGVLGYVVRWIDAGVGCSKVPDLTGTQLMEDRATCRISSQHVTNWLVHGVVSRDEVEDSLRRMAVKVDEQNAGDPVYQPMAPDFDGEAFRAARELLLEGASQPNGYTEPILHRWRRAKKAHAEGTQREVHA